MKKTLKLFSFVALVVIISFFAINSLTGVFNNVQNIQSLPLGVSNYLSDAVNFKPFSGLSFVGTPATDITCSITNNGHLLGTSGSDYKVETATGLFNPTYNSLINPDQQTLSQVKFIVYLYCKSITGFSGSSSFHPYLTGGSLTMQFYATDSNGNVVQTKAPVTVNLQQTQVDVGTNSVPIATFTVSASEIENAVHVKNVDYTSHQEVTTTGTLQFKHNLGSAYPTATYTIPSLYTGWNEIVKGIAQQTSQMQCASGYVNTVNKCVSIKQSIVITSSGYKIDKSFTDVLNYYVSVGNFNSNGVSQDVQPIVDIYRLPDTTNKIKTITLSTAQSTKVGDYTNFVGVISANKDLGGIVGSYQMTLRSEKLSSSIQRDSYTQGFNVVDSRQDPTTACSGSICSTIPLNVVFNYHLDYDDGLPQDGTSANSSPIPIKFDILKTSTTSDTPVKLTGIKFTVLAKTTDAYSSLLSISNPKLVVTGSAHVGGNVDKVTIPSSDFTLVIPSDIQYGILKGELPVSALESEIEKSMAINHPNLVYTNPQDTPVTISVDGQFDVTYQGKKGVGVISGATWTFTTLYKTSGSLTPVQYCNTDVSSQAGTINNNGLSPSSSMPNCVPPPRCTDGTYAPNLDTAQCPVVDTNAGTKLCHDGTTVSIFSQCPDTSTTSNNSNSLGVDTNAVVLKNSDTNSVFGNPTTGICIGTTDPAQCLGSIQNYFTSNPIAMYLLVFLVLIIIIAIIVHAVRRK